MIDVLILVFSFILAYKLRFDVEQSILIQWQIIEEPIGLYGTLEEYMQMLFLLIPCYLVSYYVFHLYEPKRVTSRKSQVYNILKANVFCFLHLTELLLFSFFADIHWTLPEIRRYRRPGRRSGHRLLDPSFLPSFL